MINDIRTKLDLDKKNYNIFKDELYRAITLLNADSNFNIFIRYFLEVLPQEELNKNGSLESQENLKHLAYFKTILKSIYYEKPS